MLHIESLPRPLIWSRFRMEVQEDSTARPGPMRVAEQTSEREGAS